MSTLQTRLTDLTIRIATECKAIRVLLNGNVATNSNLTTNAKNNLVAAINEVKSLITSQVADDQAASTTKTWSIDKINSALVALKAEILGGAGPAFDTLAELQALLQGEAGDIAGLLTAVGNRVRTDVDNQALTTQQRKNARTNIDAFGPDEIGNPDTDFVSTFVAGL